MPQLVLVLLLVVCQNSFAINRNSCGAVRSSLEYNDRLLKYVRATGASLSQTEPEHVLQADNLRQRLLEIVEEKIQLTDSKNAVCNGVDAIAYVTYVDSYGLRRTVKAQDILISAQNNIPHSIFDFGPKRTN